MNPSTHQQRLGIACPHCKGPARIRTSRAISDTYRQLNAACLDPSCGHTFGVELTITHTISASARPDPKIVLPVSAPRRRAANDDLPTAANDSGVEVPRVVDG